MRYQQNAVLTSLRRVQQFLDATSSVSAGLNPTARKELDDVVGQLSTLAVAQDSGARGSRGETARLHALREVLRDGHMAPIAQVAKYKLQSTPEFVALVLPAATVSVETELASATAMADAATPHAQTFTDSGLATTFLDDLRAAATDVSGSVADRNTHQSGRNGATAGLAATDQRGRALLRVLNTLVVAKVGSDAQLRREWETAKVVRGKPGPAVGSQKPVTKPVQPTGTVVTPTPSPAKTPVLVPTTAPAATTVISPSVASPPVTSPPVTTPVAAAA